jgi:hypothetical protein
VQLVAADRDVARRHRLHRLGLRNRLTGALEPGGAGKGASPGLLRPIPPRQADWSQSERRIRYFLFVIRRKPLRVYFSHDCEMCVFAPHNCAAGSHQIFVCGPVNADVYLSSISRIHRRSTIRGWLRFVSVMFISFAAARRRVRDDVGHWAAF